MENIDMTAENGMACIDAKGIRVKNIRLVTENKPVLFFLNSRDVSITGLEWTEDAHGLVEVRGNSNADITVETITPDGRVSVHKVR